MKRKISTHSLVIITCLVLSRSASTVTFSSDDYVVGPSPFAVTSGDFNNDGLLDLATGNVGDRTASVLFNRSDLIGAFGAYTSYNVGSGPRSIIASDLNGDGALDLIAANFFDNTISVFLNKNDLTGTLISHSEYPTAFGPQSITSADFNGDGAPDIAVSNRDSNGVSVFLNINDFSGYLGAKAHYPVGRMPQQINSGDFNGDGAPDLAIACTDSDVVSVLINKNNLSGVFNARVNYPTGLTPISVVSRDFNGDGADDLAVGNNDSDTVSVFLSKNDISGTFHDSVDYSVGGNPYSIISEDFDGDGAFDLASLSTRKNVLTVLPNKNDLSGAFDSKTDFSVGVVPISLSSGDYDGDGDQDLVAANLNGASVTVLLNTTGLQPDAYDFIDKVDVEQDSLTTSELNDITGLQIGVPITVTGGEYSINDGPFTASPGTIFNNDRLQVRTLSSTDYGTATKVTVTIASVTDDFTVTTLYDMVPDGFGFDDQSDVELNIPITSNAVTIAGLGASTEISVTEGEYSINNGEFTSADGFVNNGDSVVVRHTSSSAPQSTVITSLTIGGISGSFSTSTAAAAISSSSSSSSLDTSGGGGGGVGLTLLLGLLIWAHIRRRYNNN